MTIYTFEKEIGNDVDDVLFSPPLYANEARRHWNIIYEYYIPIEYTKKELL